MAVVLQRRIPNTVAVMELSHAACAAVMKGIWVNAVSVSNREMRTLSSTCWHPVGLTTARWFAVDTATVNVASVCVTAITVGISAIVMTVVVNTIMVLSVMVKADVSVGHVTVIVTTRGLHASAHLAKTSV